MNKDDIRLNKSKRDAIKLAWRDVVLKQTPTAKDEERYLKSILGIVVVVLLPSGIIVFISNRLLKIGVRYSLGGITMVKI